MAALRRFVVDQTKTYLSAMAEKTSKTAQLEAQYEALLAIASDLGHRLETVDEALSGKCDVNSMAHVARQLEQLTASKAGRCGQLQSCHQRALMIPRL